MEKMRQSRWNWVRGSAVAAMFFFTLSPDGVKGQQSLETEYRLTGGAVTGVFGQQREAIQKITAVLITGRKQVAYGLVVSADGYVLTKASEIDGVEDLFVRVGLKDFKKVEVVKVDKVWDVALVKIEAEGLDVPEYAETSDLPQGSWVIVNGATSRTQRRILVGVISANAREIPSAGGAVLGMVLKEDKGKLVIEEVSEGSGAEKADLKKGDQLISIDGQEVGKMEDLTKVMEGKSAGGTVKVAIKRGKEKLEMDVLLSARKELFEEMDRNDMMSGNFSKRRSGFPRVIQHDVLANRETMGGPVLNFEGKVIGMNIARANRAETFAIPMEELKAMVGAMLAEAGK
jgi:serine protease Do